MFVVSPLEAQTTEEDLKRLFADVCPVFPADGADEPR